MKGLAHGHRENLRNGFSHSHVKVLSITVRKGFSAQKSNQRGKEAVSNHSSVSINVNIISIQIREDKWLDSTGILQCRLFRIRLSEFKSWPYCLLKLTPHSVSQFHHLDNGNIKMIVKNKSCYEVKFLKLCLAYRKYTISLSVFITDMIVNSI